MTRCPRCQGFLHTRIVEYPKVLETHCLSCGWYFNPPPVVPTREPYWRKDRCRNCQGTCEAGFAQCPHCRAYQRQYRASLKAKRKAAA